MRGIQIRIRLDLELFDWIRILQGAIEVRSEIFQDRIPIRFKVVANPVDLRYLNLHLWKHCLTNCSFGTAYF
jgi:hypothetical protein